MFRSANRLSARYFVIAVPSQKVDSPDYFLGHNGSFADCLNFIISRYCSRSSLLYRFLSKLINKSFSRNLGSFLFR